MCQNGGGDPENGGVLIGSGGLNTLVEGPGLDFLCFGGFSGLKPGLIAPGLDYQVVFGCGEVGGST